MDEQLIHAVQTEKDVKRIVKALLHMWWIKHVKENLLYKTTLEILTVLLTLGKQMLTYWSFNTDKEGYETNAIAS